jgi:hypothetical protein
MSAGQSHRTWALLAAGAAVVLIGSMFLEWYTLELPEGVRSRGAELPTFTGFEGLDRADVAIVLAAALGIVIAVAVAAGALAGSPALGIALTAVSLFALAVVLYRGVISPPGLFFLGIDFEMKVTFGWFIGLAASLLMTVGATLTYLAGPRIELEPAKPTSPREE